MFLTPNGWSYIAIAARLLPYSLHVRYKRMMTDMPEVDTFKTYYRINSRSRIEALSREAGLRLESLDTRVGWPTYWEVHSWIHPFGLVLHWLLERGPVWFHISLLGVIIKPSTGTSVPAGAACAS